MNLLSFLRWLFMWLILPASLVLLTLALVEPVLPHASKFKVEIFLFLMATAILITFYVDKFVESSRSKQLSVVAAEIGMKFDRNRIMSDSVYQSNKGGYACFKPPTVNAFKNARWLRNIFVENGEPVIIECATSYGGIAYFTTIFRLRGETNLEEALASLDGYRIETSDGYTVYHSSKYRTNVAKIKEEYGKVRKLHLMLTPTAMSETSP